jgi:hypothetical protein
MEQRPASWPGDPPRPRCLDALAGGRLQENRVPRATPVSPDQGGDAPGEAANLAGAWLPPASSAHRHPSRPPSKGGSRSNPGRGGSIPPGQSSSGLWPLPSSQSGVPGIGGGGPRIFLGRIHGWSGFAKVPGGGGRSATRGRRSLVSTWTIPAGSSRSNDPLRRERARAGLCQEGAQAPGAPEGPPGSPRERRAV